MKTLNFVFDMFFGRSSHLIPSGLTQRFLCSTVGSSSYAIWLALAKVNLLYLPCMSGVSLVMNDETHEKHGQITLFCNF